MAVNQFLKKVGFTADPFESTNAEHEPHLADYFVPPPYFTAVMGDASHPRSDVILAPRGSGKTAQRRMIEDASVDSGLLCITYDVFDLPTGSKLADVDLAFHLRNICRRLLIGILLALEEDPFRADSLSKHQKELLKLLVETRLGSVSAAEFKEGIDSVKSLGNKVNDLWRKYGGVVAAGLQALMAKAGMGNVNIPDDLALSVKRDDDLRYQFSQLIMIARNIGFEAVYILVDRVDETQLTAADAGATFELISPLVTDLTTLETAGVGFKLFLWDQIGAAYREKGGRPDRVQIHELEWTVSELRDLLGRRLSSFSAGQVTSLSQLVCADVQLDLDLLVAYFSNGSPRDSIRIAGAIFAEATRTTDAVECISSDAIWGALRRFSDQRASEIVPQYLSELRKIGAPTFTINRVANDIFHVKAQSARSKIQKWTATGAVAQIGEIPNQNFRPQHLYGITDLRVLLSAQAAQSIELLLGNLVFVCPDCAGLILSGENSFDCASCGRAATLQECDSLLTVLSKPKDA